MSFPLASEAAVRADEGWLRQCTHHRRRARRGCSSFRGVAGRQTFLRMGEMHKKVCTGNQRVLRGRKGEVGSRAYTGERGRWTSGSTTRSDLKKDAGQSGCGAAGQGKPASWPDSFGSRRTGSVLALQRPVQRHLDPASLRGLGRRAVCVCAAPAAERERERAERAPGLGFGRSAHAELLAWRRRSATLVAQPAGQTPPPSIVTLELCACV